MRNEHTVFLLISPVSDTLPLQGEKLYDLWRDSFFIHLMPLLVISLTRHVKTKNERCGKQSRLNRPNQSAKAEEKSASNFAGPRW